MIEIELFYKIVESEIRRKHIKYLKKQKCLPSDNSAAAESETPSSDEQSTLSAAADVDEFIYSDKPELREKAKRVKAFNKGIETALKALQGEYKRFIKRIETEE